MAIRCLSFATCILTLTILVLGICAELPLNCGGNVLGIVFQCKKFVEKDAPQNPPLADLEACCASLEGVNASCYCKNVTPDIENAINMEKALFVANACKVPNVPTDKCGSYIIPRPPPAFKA
ncbi:hypothetical protein RYX36_005985 [Vicia faba]